MNEYEKAEKRIRDGGPAFPQPDAANMSGERGMTLRDYFAAKIIQGICSLPETNNAEVKNITFAAYKIADAMLAAREVQS